jgi:hypothetical protein
LQPRGRRRREVASKGGGGEDRGEQGEASFHGWARDGRVSGGRGRPRS